MMTKDADKNRMQIQYFCMNDLVPEDHLLRLIEEAILKADGFTKANINRSLHIPLGPPVIRMAGY